MLICVTVSKKVAFRFRPLHLTAWAPAQGINLSHNSSNLFSMGRPADIFGNEARIGGNRRPSVQYNNLTNQIKSYYFATSMRSGWELWGRENILF